MYLSVDNKMYSSCSGADAIANVLRKEFTKTPISSATENALSKLSDMINKSIFIVAANEKRLTSIEQIEDKLSDCTNTKSALPLMNQITDVGKRAVLDAFQGKGYQSADDADKGYARELVLKAICYPTVKTSTALLNVLDSYNSVLGLNLSGFNALSPANRGEAIVAFSGQNPGIGSMQSVLDNIVGKYNSQTPAPPSGGGGGSSGGSGGSGGSFIAPTMPSVTNTPDASQGNTSVFKDLTDVWCA